MANPRLAIFCTFAFMSETYSHFLQHPVFKVVSELCSQQNIPAFVIGGYVRDAFLGRLCKDIDIVVVGDGPEFASLVAAKLRVKNLSIYKRYGTAHFRYKDLDVEFVGARKESYTLNSSDNRIATCTRSWFGTD